MAIRSIFLYQIQIRMSQRDGWIVEYSNRSENSKHIAELVINQRKPKARNRNSCRRNPPPPPRFYSNHPGSSTYNSKNYNRPHSSHKPMLNTVTLSSSNSKPLMYNPPIQPCISAAQTNGPNFVNMYQQMAVNQQYHSNARQNGLINYIFATNPQQQYNYFMETQYMQQQYNKYIGTPFIQQQQYNQTANVNDLAYRLQNVQLNNLTERRFVSPHTRQRQQNTNIDSRQSRPKEQSAQLDVKLKENSHVKSPAKQQPLTSQCNNNLSQPNASNSSSPSQKSKYESLQPDIDANRESNSNAEIIDQCEIVSNSSIDSILCLTKSKEDLFNQIRDGYESISDESFNGSENGNPVMQANPPFESNDHYEALSDDSDAIPDLSDVRAGIIFF